LANEIRNFTEAPNIDDLMAQVNNLLDDSIATVGYVIHPTEKNPILDLSRIDFDALKERFKKGRKHTEAEKLKAAIARKLTKMVRENKTRSPLLDKFNQLIELYNKGLDIEGAFNQLVLFASELNEEDRRGMRESLSNEELAVFDLLMKPAPELSATERKDVKAVARKLLITLKETKLVLDWRKKLKTRADVISTVRQVLDDLPRVFTNDLYDQKCDVVFQHIYDSYMGEGESIYGNASPNEGLVKYNRI
jgi:type I restriction enzyme R subunit